MKLAKNRKQTLVQKITRWVRVNEKGYRIGEDHHRAKLSDHEVELIHRLRGEGWSTRRIATAMEVPRRTVRDCLDGGCRSQVGVRVLRIVGG